ncbi:MAG: type II secretion system F family protein [Candidatus Gastranaerophilales bacterium]|nr:type II secretion system F family protein [bacterium]MBQ8886356.1 type II secretion system F family protein [Candidatus Gastranaerophilales bacterium]
MTRYEYEAEKWNGEKVKGRIDAKSQAEVKVRVKNMGYKLVAIREFTSNQQGAKSAALQSLSLKEKIDFTQTFLTLNKAGLPIIESLIFIEKDAASRQVRLLAQEIKTQIIAGYTLSDTISKYPNLFGQVYIGLAKAGEDSGEIDKTFERLIELLKKQGDIKGKVISALTYPIFVVLLAIAVVLVMLMFVFPAFKDMFEQQGKKLPAITQFCIDSGEFLKDKWAVIPIAIVAFVFSGIYLMKWEPSKRKIDEIILKVPLLGDLTKAAAFSNFLTVLQIAYDAGIPIIECLYLSRTTLSNFVMQDAIKVSIKKMQAGAHLSESLKAANLFPKMILFMVSTGEQSGRLGELMTQSVNQIDQQLDLIIETLGKLIEPILLIFIGVIVCFLALALYLPLFQSYSV